MMSVGTGLAVAQGSVSIRGSIFDVGQGVTPCNWGTEACSVDAAYIDRGTAAGPFRTDGTSLVCGTVITRPWLPAEGPDVASVFSGGSCDGSSSPETQLADSIAAANVRISHACDGLGPDVCDVAEIYQACLSAAQTLAEQSLFVSLPGGSTLADVGSAAVDAGSGIIQVADLPGTGTLGFVLGLANTIRSTANTIFQLKAAYDSCP